MFLSGYIPHTCMGTFFNTHVYTDSTLGFLEGSFLAIVVFLIVIRG